MNYTRRLGGSALLATALFLTCKSEERPKTLEDPGELPGPPQGLSGMGGTRTDTSTAGTGGGNGGSGQAATNCGDVLCSGAGKCIEEDGEARCVCDKGYTLLSDVCVVDETCIQIRPLELGCRQLLESEPALAITFNMETCAGTTVRPDVLGDLSQAFKVLEDDNDLGDESYAAVFKRNVENDVVIAVDLSTSVATDPGLAQSLFEALDGLVDDLTPGPGESKVYVQLIVFGRSVDTALPFTDNMQEVKDKLAELQADLDHAVVDPVGTNLNGVINQGVAALTSIWSQRFISTYGSVLSTGTLITITDGVDTSGEDLDDIDESWNLISVGVSNDIDDAELERIGPHGSFLAPTSGDRVAIFQRIAQRVAEYRDRSYVLAYCSPAVANDHEVWITLASGEADLILGCEFDAENFGVGQGVCTADFINGYCDSGVHGCGTFLACNTCQPDAGVNPDDSWNSTED